MSKIRAFFRDLYDLLSGRASREFAESIRRMIRKEERRTLLPRPRGNAALASGAYVTADDLEREREEIRQLDFVQFAKKRRLLPQWMLFPVEQRALHKLARAISAKWRERGRGRQ
jgi:hypothetical protein